MLDLKNVRLAVLGLGYVGLPLAVEFSKKRKVIGFDVNQNRINQLKNNYDINGEYNHDQLRQVKNLHFVSELKETNCNCYIITAPTPIDEFKKPNLSYIKNATEIVAKVLKKHDFVIYESTVYPGCTEEICVPILEKNTNLKFNVDFYCGYSPERINPGDKLRTIKDIKKITSGSTEQASNLIEKLYSEIIEAGTIPVKSIKVAEAAKVIENSQRDLNIALMNELSIIFDKMGIDTEEVLTAAETKWNFHKYRPGLVGGHCIGVDPYYLTYKSEELGYIPEIILAGRRLNDLMSSHVVDKLIKNMIKKNIEVNNSNVLVMGLTFKENCKDLRNSKVFDIISELKDLNVNVDIFDPIIDQNLTDLNMVHVLKDNFYDAIIIAVAHDEFKKFSNKDLKKASKSNSIIFDLKHLLKSNEVDLRL